MGYLITIFIASILTHNIALTYLLGMCPFVSLSRSLKTACGMSVAVIFVVTLTSAINWPIYHFILVPTGSTIISYIVYIIVIAASVQLVEMIVEKGAMTRSQLLDHVSELVADFAEGESPP